MAAPGNPNSLSLEELMGSGGGSGVQQSSSPLIGGGGSNPNRSLAAAGGGGGTGGSGFTPSASPVQQQHPSALSPAQIQQPRPQSGATTATSQAGGAGFASPVKPSNPINDIVSPQNTSGAGGGGAAAVTPHWGQQQQNNNLNNSSHVQQPNNRSSPSPGARSQDPTQAWINASNTDPHPADVDQEMKPLLEEQRHPMIALAFVAFTSFVCCFIQTGVYAYTYERGSATLYMTLWNADFCIVGATTTACAASKLPFSSWCAAMDSRWRAMQAFSILVILYSAVILFLGYAVIDLERTKTFFWNQVVKHFKPINFILCVSLGYWLFTMILWALVAGSYHVAPCADTVPFAQKNRLMGVLSLFDSGFKMSAGFSLPLVMWFWWTMVILWIVFRQSRYSAPAQLGRSGSAVSAAARREGSPPSGGALSLPPHPSALRSPSGGAGHR